MILKPEILLYDLIVLSSQAMVHYIAEKSAEVVSPSNHYSFHLITPFKDKIREEKVYVTYVDDETELPPALTRKVIVIEKDVMLPCGWDLVLKSAVEKTPDRLIVPTVTDTQEPKQRSPLILSGAKDLSQENIDWFAHVAEEEIELLEDSSRLATPIYAFDREIWSNFSQAKWAIAKHCTVINHEP
jgi:hypothetical protein